MGLSKIALNLAERTASYAKMLGKSSILETKPINSVDINGLKYSANIKTDTFLPKKIDKWKDGIETVRPYANSETTMVEEHHYFHSANSDRNLSLEYLYKQTEKDFAGRPSEILDFKKEDLKHFAEMNVRSLKDNRKFLKVQPQPHQCTVFRGRYKDYNQYSDFEIINKAKIGDEIIPSGGFAYAAHIKAQASDYIGTNGMLYEIIVPKGSQISVNMEHGGEAVFPALSKFKLLKKETRYIKSYADEVQKTPNAKAYPYTYVKMEYIPQIPTLPAECENMNRAELRKLAQKAIDLNCKTWADFAELPKKLGS